MYINYIFIILELQDNVLPLWYNLSEVKRKGHFELEKVIWVRSYGKTLTSKDDDGLDEVNRYLAAGWKVKHITSSPMGPNLYAGQAYIVIEKDDE